MKPVHIITPCLLPRHSKSKPKEEHQFEFEFMCSLLDPLNLTNSSAFRIESYRRKSTLKTNPIHNNSQKTCRKLKFSKENRNTLNQKLYYINPLSNGRHFTSELSPFDFHLYRDEILMPTKRI